MAKKSEEKKLGKPYKLAVKIGTIVLLAITILMSALVLVSSANIEKIVTADYKQLAEEITVSRSQYVSNWIYNYITDLGVYTGSDAVKTGDEQTVISWLQKNTRLRNKEYDYMFFSPKDGTTYRDTGLKGAKGGIVERDYYKAIFKEHKREYIGNVIKSKTSGQFVVPVTRGAYDENGNLFGIFTGMLGIDRLKEEIASIKVGAKGYLFLTDSENKIIAHPDSGKVLTTFDSSSTVARLIQSNKIEQDYEHTDNGKVFVLTSPIQSAEGWHIGICIPESQLKEASSVASQVILSIGLVTGIVIFIFVFLNIISITGELKRMGGVVEELASGDADLTQRFTVTENNEMGAVLISFNKFIGKLQTIMTSIKNAKGNLIDAGTEMASGIESSNDEVKHITDSIRVVDEHISSQSQSVEETASAVTEISQNIESLNKMIQDQSTSIVEASSSIEEMIGNINAVNQSVNKMSNEFNELENDTKVGIEKNSSVNTQLLHIAEQSTMLMDANTVIQSIAEQTNLLAMNAAIEAAHAGDAGKGFSVVADEIRKLAETSAEQSKRIGDELENIQNGITDVVKASGESEKALSSVSNRISSTGELVSQISSAMEEQNQGSQQILIALKSMNNSTTEVKQSSEQMKEGNLAILQEVKLLQESTSQIKEAMHTITSGADEITAVSDSLGKVSNGLSQSISDIGKEIDLFQV